MKKRDRTKNREEGKLEDERLYNKEKIRKGNTQKVKHKRKSHKGKNNPSWLLLFVPVFIKI